MNICTWTVNGRYCVADPESGLCSESKFLTLVILKILLKKSIWRVSHGRSLAN